MNILILVVCGQFSNLPTSYSLLPCDMLNFTWYTSQNFAFLSTIPQTSQSPTASTHSPATSARSHFPSTVYIETYGCQMNTNDSDIVRSILTSAGYTTTPHPHQAGAILLNTCAIREKAETRVWNRLTQLNVLQQKWRLSDGHRRVVGVLGCMAERLKGKLLERSRGKGGERSLA